MRSSDLMQRPTGRRWQGWLLAAPPLLYVVLLLALPMAGMLLLSVWTQTYLDLDRTLSLANYREAFTEPVYRILMLRSVLVACLVTAITVTLAFPVAYFVSFHVQPARKSLWLFMITIPFWTSYLVRIFLWKVILGYNGIVNGSLIGLGLIDEPLRVILYNLSAVIVTLSHAWMPFAVLPIFVALETIDRSLLEAARDLGDGKLRRFWRIIVPLVRPGLVGACLIVFIPTIGDYVTPRLVGGPDGLLIANMIELQFRKANNPPLGAALAVTTLIIVAMMASLFLVMTRQRGANRYGT